MSAQIIAQRHAATDVNVAVEHDESAGNARRAPDHHTNTQADGKAALKRLVSVDAKQVPLAQVLSSIDKQAQLGLSYSPLFVPVKRPVTVHLKNVTAKEALVQVLRGTGIHVTIGTGGQVVLVREESQVVDSTTGTITGHIIEAATKTPLSGVSIVLEGTKIGTTSRPDGGYTITGVPTGAYTLRVTRLGYQPMEVQAIVQSNKTVSLITELTPVPVRLNDVITTAAGTQKRLELGNSISTINADSVVRAAPIRNISDLLAGRAPGTSVLQSSGVSGSGSRVRIRGLARISGSNDPIVIVDGVRLNADYSSGSGGENQAAASFSTSATSRLNDIDPNTIETIDILKGPSAATLYGSDAADGVIVITTKRGKAGPARWSFTGERGTMSIKEHYDETYTGWGTSVTGGPDSPCTLLDEAAGSCTIDSVTHWNPLNHSETSPFGTGKHTQINGQVSGGSDRMQYFFSGDFLDELGVLRMPDADVTRLLAARHGDAIPDWQMHPNKLQKQAGTSRVSATFGETGDLALTTSFIHQNQRNVGDQLVVSRALQAVGYRDANDGWPSGGSPAEIFAPHVTNEILRGYAALNGNTRPFPWLSGRGTVGVDYTNKTDESLTRPGDVPGFYVNGNRTKVAGNTAVYSLDLGSTATVPVNGFLTSRTTIGTQYNRTESSSITGSGNGLSLGQETFNGATTTTLSEAYDELITLGWYLEETGVINNRLFLTAAMRQDAGSAFGSDVHAPVYPKLSMSWLVSREPFFPKFDILSNLRLRAAYGQAGVQPGSSDAIRTYTPGQGFVDGVPTNVAYLNGIGNAKLLPERGTEFEGGFDLSFLEDRFTVEGTYYRKESQNALASHVLPPSSGVYSRRENIGKVLNTGTEWNMTAQPILTQLFTWDLNFGLSRNSNKLVTLGPNAPPIGNNQERYVPGYPLSGRWEYPILAYHDVNGNGILEPNEIQLGDSMVFVGQTIPSRQSTLTSTFGFWNSRLRITTMFDFQGGLGQVAQGLETRCAGHKCRAAVDPHTPLAQQAAVLATAYPALSLYGFVQPVSWTRFRELTIAYDVPQSIARRLHTNSATIALLGRNLALWSGYMGADPEVNNAPIRELTRDDGTVPPSRDWVLRITLGL
jgi:TonB-linked SusC/RagA family outer membrane protein